MNITVYICFLTCIKSNDYIINYDDDDYEMTLIKIIKQTELWYRNRNVSAEIKNVGI